MFGKLFIDWHKWKDLAYDDRSMAEPTVLTLTEEAKETIWIRWFLGLGQLRKTAKFLIGVVKLEGVCMNPFDHKFLQSYFLQNVDFTRWKVLLNVW